MWDLTPDPHEVDGLMLWKEFMEVGVQAGVYWLARKDGSLVEVAYRAKAKIAPGRHLTTLLPHDSPEQAFRAIPLLALRP